MSNFNEIETFFEESKVVAIRFFVSHEGGENRKIEKSYFKYSALQRVIIELKRNLILEDYNSISLQLIKFNFIGDDPFYFIFDETKTSDIKSIDYWYEKIINPQEILDENDQRPNVSIVFREDGIDQDPKWNLIRKHLVKRW